MATIIATKTLLALPSELVAHITTYLDDRDVFAARLTSKSIEAASLSHFGHRFFRKKGYMLTSPSLQVLQKVAEHEELRKHVQHIWFNPDCFTFVRPDCAPDLEEMPDPDDPESLLKLLSKRDRPRYEAYCSVMKDHTELLKHDAKSLTVKLTTTFATLPNLKIIGMRRSEDYAPWGWRALCDAVGEDPRVLGPIPTGPMRSLSGPTILFLALIRAVAASNVTLRRFYTDVIEIDNIRPLILTQELLDKALGSVWYLEINATKGNIVGRSKDCKGNRFTHVNGDGLTKLLKATMQLKEIGLQIFPDRKQSHILAPRFREPESWRESYPYLCLERIVREVQLPWLGRVKLEKITTSPATLIGFLHPCAERLTSLKIRDVRLLSDNEHPYPWKTFFGFLRDSCPALSYILFYHLLHSTGGISFIRDPPLPLHPSETDPTTGAPNPPFNSGADIEVGEEFFMKYEHMAIEVNGAGDVRGRVGKLVEEHWYHRPIFSYQMDEGLWHTDTSGEEW